MMLRIIFSFSIIVILFVQRGYPQDDDDDENRYGDLDNDDTHATYDHAEKEENFNNEQPSLSKVARERRADRGEDTTDPTIMEDDSEDDKIFPSTASDEDVNEEYDKEEENTVPSEHGQEQTITTSRELTEQFSTSSAIISNSTGINIDNNRIRSSRYINKEFVDEEAPDDTDQTETDQNEENDQEESGEEGSTVVSGDIGEQEEKKEHSSTFRRNKQNLDSNKIESLLEGRAAKEANTGTSEEMTTMLKEHGDRNDAELNPSTVSGETGGDDDRYNTSLAGNRSVLLETLSAIVTFPGDYLIDSDTHSSTTAEANNDEDIISGGSNATTSSSDNADEDLSGGGNATTSSSDNADEDLSGGGNATTSSSDNADGNLSGARNATSPSDNADEDLSGATNAATSSSDDADEEIISDDDGDEDIISGDSDATTSSSDDADEEEEIIHSTTISSADELDTEEPPKVDEKKLLGQYGLHVAFYLRENIMNLLGYIMYQTNVDLAPEIYHYVYTIKFGLEMNIIDVFRLIAVLPQMEDQSPDDQLKILLERIGEQCDPKYCYVTCAANAWSAHPAGPNIAMAISHLGFNPIMQKILEMPEDRDKLTDLVAKLQNTQHDQISTFSPYIVRIWNEHRAKLTILDARFLGYMLPFFPWPGDCPKIQQALNVLTRLLVDETKQNLEWRGIRVSRRHKHPLPMLEQLMASISESHCHATERAAAEFLLHNIRTQMASTDYRRYIRGHHVEINRLSQLLSIITHKKYPPEIVFAAQRIKRFVDKVIYYIDYSHFTAYKYHTKAEMLYAFLEFILQETRFCPIEIKKSIFAVKAYLLFQTGSVYASYDVLVHIIHGFMAPDLHDHIRARTLTILTLVLDQSVAIKRILNDNPTKKCNHMMSCYFEIISLITADADFKSEANAFKLHQSLIDRYTNIENVKKARCSQESVSVVTLLSAVDYRDFTREIVQSAKNLKKYIQTKESSLSANIDHHLCTKQEALVAALGKILAEGSFLSDEMQAIAEAVLIAVKFKVNPGKRPSADMLYNMAMAWQTPFTDPATMKELIRVSGIAKSDAKDIDQILADLDKSACTDNMENCYNDIARHINSEDIGMNIKLKTEDSPELDPLNVGELSSMTTKKLAAVINAIRKQQDSNELEAAKLYLDEFAIDLDVPLMQVDCTGLKVRTCLESINEHLRALPNLGHIQINIIQYLLLPTTCSKKYCWWFPYEEKASTVLNPLLMFMIFAIGSFSLEQDSFHAAMDFAQVIAYLGDSDVEDALNAFKLSAYSDDMLRIGKFLGLLRDLTLADNYIGEGVVNLLDLMQRSSHARRLHWGNLLYMREVFKANTTNYTVKVELTQVGNKIALSKVEVEDILKHIIVDVSCYTMETCVIVLKRQLSAPAYFDKPPSKLILRLLNPISCMNDREICPWIGLNPQSILPEIVLPSLDDRINNPDVFIMERIVLKVLRGLMVGSPDLIAEIIKDEIQPPIEDILAQLIAHEKTPDEWYKYAKELQTKDWKMDANVLIQLLKEMVDNTHNEAVKTTIQEAIHTVETNKPTTEHYVEEIRMRCKTFPDCVQHLFKVLISKGLCDKETVMLLIKVFQSRSCLKTDCPWQVKYDESIIQLHKTKLEEYLNEIKSAGDTPLHIAFDIMDVIEYLRKTHLSSDIYDFLLCSKDSTDKKYRTILEMITKCPKVPTDIKDSINNILNYLKSKQLPSFLHVTGLVRIVITLKGQTREHTVIAVLDNGLSFIDKFREDLKILLKQLPVECVDLEKCLNSLTVELKKLNDNNIAVSIVSLLKPEICNMKTCPWMESSISGKVREMQIALIQEMRKLQRDPSISIHIKLDVQAMKKMVRGLVGSLSKLPPDALQNRENLLPLFFKTVDYKDFEKFDMLVAKKDIEEFLVNSKLPKYMDVPTLLIFGDVLKHMTKSDSVKMEIEEQRTKIERAKFKVKDIMMACKVNCLNVKSCAETMELCLSEEKLASERPSHIVRKMIRPDWCAIYSCPWLPSESREVLAARLEDIKEELKQHIEDEDIPVIIRIMMTDFLAGLDIDKIERYLAGISEHNPEKLFALLKYMKKDKRKFTQDEYRRIQRIYAYLRKRKVPPHLVSGDLPGLVAWLIDLCNKHPEVMAYLESGLNIVMKMRPEVDNHLIERCPVQCIEIKDCMFILYECLAKAKPVTARWLAQLLYPEPCTPEICPWVPEEHVPIEIENPMIPKPHIIYSNRVIIFYKERKKIKYTTLKMDHKKSLIMLEAFTFLAESTVRRVTVVSAKGSHAKYNIDYNLMKGIGKVGVSIKPVIDFAQMDSIIICVRYKNGNIRPLKFDLMAEGVKEGLKKLAGKSRSSGTTKKTMVTVKDENGKSSSLVINVLDQTKLRQILELTIDNIMPAEYWPMFFWPRKAVGEPWKSSVIHDQSPLEAYLRNIPGLDFANRETPIVIVSDGIITMDFDVNNLHVVDGIETAVAGQDGLLDLTKQKKYMFYIPYPFQKNMIQLPVDFADPYTLEVLQEANRKFPIESKEITIQIKQTDQDTEKPLELQFDFYGDVLFYIHHRLNNKPNDPDAGKPNLVIIPIDHGKDIVVLDLMKVRNILLNEFAEKPQQKHVQVINIPDGVEGQLPITLDPDDAIVVQMLRSLMANSLDPFEPVSTVATEGKGIILLGAIDKNFKVVLVILEDSLANKIKIEEENIQVSEEPNCEIPFGAGKVKTSYTAIFNIMAADGFDTVNMTAPTYLRRSNLKKGETCIPYEFEGKYYYVTLVDNSDVNTFFKQSKISTGEDGGITFIQATRKGKLKVITLPLGNQELLSKMRNLAARVEIQPRIDAVMVIISRDETDDSVHHYILDLSNPSVLPAVEDIVRKVRPKSTTKGLFNYVDEKYRLKPLILDHSEYKDNLILKELTALTPVDLKPQRIPNLEGPIPQIALMIEQEDGPQVIILNPADREVWVRLGSVSTNPDPRNIPLLLLGPENRIKMFYFNRSDPVVTELFVALSSKSTPLQIPTKPIPLDGSSRVIVDLSTKVYDMQATVNTRQEKQLNQLLENQKILPLTQPLMMVLGPDGTGIKVRIDTRIIKDQLQTDCFMVINSIKDRAIAVPVSHEKVSTILSQMVSEEIHKNGEMLVFTDVKGQVHQMRINTKDDGVIEKLWQLQQIETPKELTPFVIVPKYARPHYVFTVMNNKGENEVVILDVSNFMVRTQLIKLWDKTNRGVALKIRDKKDNPIIIHIDLNDRRVARKVLELKEETEMFTTPITGGKCLDDANILKIPFVEAGKRFLIYCNVTKQVVVDSLLRIPGRSIIDPKGAAFMVPLMHGEVTPMYLDLDNERVMAKVKKVCPHKKEILDSSQVMLFSMMNAQGLREVNVLDLNNEQVVNELLRKAKPITTCDESTRSNNMLEIPLLDEQGSAKQFKIDMNDANTLDLIQYLSQLTTGKGSIETTVIPGSNADTMVMWGSSGAIMIDQNNADLIENILALSQPNNPNAYKFTFRLSTGELKAGYFDISDKDMMEELKKIANIVIKDTVVPPTQLPKLGVIKLPCVNRNNQPTEILLDSTDDNVLAVLKELSAASLQNNRYNIKLSVSRNKVVQGVFYLDTTNVESCLRLASVSVSQKHSSQDGSILILNIRSDEAPVIFLDLANPKVFNALKRLSDQVELNKATHLTLCMGPDGKMQLLKFDIRSKEAQRILLQLSKLTPYPSAPMAIANPNEELPMIVFTAQNRRGDVRHMLLNMANPTVVKLLDRIASRTKHPPKKPMEIIYADPVSGNTRKYTLDAKDDNTINSLYRLTLKARNLRDAILNYPQKNALMPTNFDILVDNNMGTAETVRIDLNDVEFLDDLKQARNTIPRSSTSLVMYFKDNDGRTLPIRAKPSRVLRAVGKYMKIFMVESKYILAITLKNKKGQIVPLILNLQNKEVLNSIIELSQNIPIDKYPYTLVTIATKDNKIMTIRLNLRDKNVRRTLIKLADKTPSPTAPVLIESPLGRKPLMVFTIKGQSKRVAPIILDLNDIHVMDTLIELTEPDEEHAWSVSMEEYCTQSCDKDTQIRINPHLLDVRKELEHLGTRIPHIAVPITAGEHTQIITLPVKVGNKIVNVHLNIKDSSVTSKLIEITKAYPVNPTDAKKAGVSFYINDGRGSQILIVLNMKNKRIIKEITQMQNQVIPPSQVTLRPPTGILALIYLTIETPQSIISVTIDPNNPKVIALLKQISKSMEGSTNAIQIHIPQENGKTLTITIDPLHPKIKDILGEINSLAPIGVDPTYVIPPNGTIPILSIEIIHDSKLIVLNIDLNNPEVIKLLQQHHKPNAHGTTTIEFIQPNGKKIVFHLDFTDTKLINKLLEITGNPPLKIKPRPNQYALIEITYGSKTFVLDLNKPETVKLLIELENKFPHKDSYTEITVPQPDGGSTVIKLDLSNPKVIDKILESLKPDPGDDVPCVDVPTDKIKLSPVFVIPPKNTYALLMVTFHPVGSVTLDINNKKIRDTLVNLPKDKSILIKIYDTNGQAIVIPINPNNKKVQKIIKKLPKHPVFSFIEKDQLLPTLVIKNKKESVPFDLMEPRDVQKLKKLHKPSSSAYTILIPLPSGNVVVAVSPEDVTANIKPDSTPATWATSKWPETTGIDLDDIDIDQELSTMGESSEEDFDLTPKTTRRTIPTIIVGGSTTRSTFGTLPTIDDDDDDDSDEDSTTKNHKSTTKLPVATFPPIDDNSPSTTDGLSTFELIDDDDDDDDDNHPTTNGTIATFPTIDDDHKSTTKLPVATFPPIDDNSPSTTDGLSTFDLIDDDDDDDDDDHKSTTKSPTADTFPPIDDNNPSTTDGLSTFEIIDDDDDDDDDHYSTPKGTIATFPTIDDDQQSTTKIPTADTFPPIDDNDLMPDEFSTFETIGDDDDDDDDDDYSTTKGTIATFPTIDDGADIEWTTRPLSTTDSVSVVDEWDFTTPTDGLIDGTITAQPADEYPLYSIYWLSVNITNPKKKEIRMYTFDLSKPKILQTLILYSKNVPRDQAIYVIRLKLPNKIVVLYINPYYKKTFKLFEKLTKLSTGRGSLLIGVIKQQTWWTFTIYDKQQKPIQIELDVGNPNVVKKIIDLSNMFIKGSEGLIIKGDLPNGEKLQLLVDINNPTALLNLLQIVQESKGSLPRPLKPLVEVRPPNRKHLLMFKIEISGADKPLEITLDIANPKVVNKLKHLHDEKNGMLTLTLNINNKKMIIKLNIANKKTLKALIDLTKISTGKDVIFDLDIIPNEIMTTSALITIEIYDGTESLPVTLNIADKSVWNTLKQIQTKDTKYATVIKITHADGQTEEIYLNVHDKQVMGILMAIGIPTIKPRDLVTKHKQITFILIQKKKKHYEAIQLDLSDKKTIIFLIEAIRRHQHNFQKKTYLQVRDDNGQYVTVAVDLTVRSFVKDLTRIAFVSRRHQIEFKNYPQLVFCFPDENSKTGYSVYKFRLNQKVLDVLKKVPATDKAVMVSVVDAGVAFKIDPSASNFVKALHTIPGICLIQRSTPKPIILIYTVENNIVRPVYINLQDKKTINKLIEMHNKYVSFQGKQALTLIRYVTSDGDTEFLMVYINNQIALHELNRYTIQVSHHTFMKQTLQRLVKFKIPQGYGDSVEVLLNLADQFVIDELKKLSKKTSYSQVYLIMTTAYGEELKLYLDFKDKTVVSKLVSLSYRQ